MGFQMYTSFKQINVLPLAFPCTVTLGKLIGLLRRCGKKEKIVGNVIKSWEIVVCSNRPDNPLLKK